MTPTLLLILDGWGLTEKGEGQCPLGGSHAPSG